ncbi:MAG: DUF1700 domain-containing protein [Lachnospiraceae bacterium]|nr:DUF1700 domain-containing protein [Lachnospiraceae bacterium]
MNKVGFMSRLEGLLADIPAAEREEALQYYDDYFEDAGAESEEAVIRTLGSPQSIAENIKAELKGEAVALRAKAGDHALAKYDDLIEEAGKERESITASEETKERKYAETQNAWENINAWGERMDRFLGRRENSTAEKMNGMPSWVIAVIIIVLLVAAPGRLGCLFGIIGALLGIVAAWFAVIIAFGVAAIGCFLGAIALLAVGAAVFVESPIVFMALLGAGMLCGCLGVLFLMFTVWMSCSVTPRLIKGIGFLCSAAWGGVKKLMHKAGL